MTAGLALVVVGSFMPWLRSGRAWRNSYDVVRTADRLGLVGEGHQRIFAVSWYLVPLLVGLTLTAIVFERRRLSYLGSTAVGALVVTMAAIAWHARFRSGGGPDVAAFGALLAIVGSIVAAADRRARASGPGRPMSMMSSVTQIAGRRRRSAR